MGEGGGAKGRRVRVQAVGLGVKAIGAEYSKAGAEGRGADVVNEMNEKALGALHSVLVSLVKDSLQKESPWDNTNQSTTSTHSSCGNRNM